MYNFLKKFIQKFNIYFKQINESQDRKLGFFKLKVKQKEKYKTMAYQQEAFD